MSLNLLLSILLVLVFAFSYGCEQKADSAGTKGATTQAAADRCPHEIKQDKCPFCNPKLVESDGFCGEHGVAESLCVQCRPYLKAAFRVKGDWCKEHNTPVTQCVQCNPALKEKFRPGEHGGAAPKSAGKPAANAANCEHGIAKAKCPFCTPSLIQSDGFCKEHDVAEALCVKCRPYLESAFKAKGDWCSEHGAPKSQCAARHQDPKNEPKGAN